VGWTANQLPPPSEHRTGWPWTSLPVIDHSNGDSALPRVTIVTPSFNQGQFIEETIRSVLLQDYPNLEYIIIDGGSTDNTLDIIRRYSSFLTYWVSEPDQGQADAVQKGWRHGTGEILAYLNSDDAYLPNAIASAVRGLNAHPNALAVCGGELWIDSQGIVIKENRPRSATWHALMQFEFIPQPAVFLRRSAFQRAGGFNLGFRNVFDFELWTRLAMLGDIQCINRLLAVTRWHSSTKTTTQRLAIARELKQVVEKNFATPMGQQLSTREQKMIQAKLHYLTFDIYLDQFPQSAKLAMHELSSAIGAWSPIGGLIVKRFLYRWGVAVQQWASRGKTTLPFRGNTGIHWSRWISEGRQG
jgi:GT2 family glycosyltransferase